MKAPDNNILEFVLSNKVILVEGDAEYMLIDALYAKATEKTLEEDDVHVISVGGTSFKRYMEIAKALKIKTAVIRDNDKDYQAKCVDNYTDYIADNIKVFSDTNNDNYTFEVCLYHKNKDICDSLFSGGNIKKLPLEFMLDNKAESALRLVDKYSEDLDAPEYIQQAIQWINE
jgi:predicted ATP-dependent endonuclease of OLD family